MKLTDKNTIAVATTEYNDFAGAHVVNFLRDIYHEMYAVDAYQRYFTPYFLFTLWIIWQLVPL